MSAIISSMRFDKRFSKLSNATKTIFNLSSIL